MLTEYFQVQLRQSMRVVLPLDSTAEVMSLRAGEICPIPGIPPAVLGVVNQRGRLLWVVELSDLLGVAPPSQWLQSQDKLTLVVITASSAYSNTGQESRQLGCVVTALQGILPLDSAKFKPVARQSPTLGSFLSGVAEIEQSPVAVLNTDAVFTALSVPTTYLVPQI